MCCHEHPISTDTSSHFIPLIYLNLNTSCSFSSRSDRMLFLDATSFDCAIISFFFSDFQASHPGSLCNPTGQSDCCHAAFHLPWRNSETSSLLASSCMSSQIRSSRLSDFPVPSQEFPSSLFVFFVQHLTPPTTASALHPLTSRETSASPDRT